MSSQALMLICVRANRFPTPRTPPPPALWAEGLEKAVGVSDAAKVRQRTRVCKDTIGPGIGPRTPSTTLSNNPSATPASTNVFNLPVGPEFERLT